MISKKTAQRWIGEGLVCLLAFAAIIWVFKNIQLHFLNQNKSFGFQFLNEIAGFDISETFPFLWKGGSELLFQWKVFSSGESYALALATGLMNSIKVAVVAGIFATAAGVVLALFSSSKKTFIKRPVIFLIGFFRSVPLLVQLLFWYVLVLEVLPEVAQSIQISKYFFLNNRGLFIPGLVPQVPWGLSLEFPELVFEGRNIAGGWQLSPEFLSLFIGLGIYAAGYVGEVLRAALESLPKGQWEAATSLGLTKFQAFRYVLFPQALQRAVPPLISQYLNLLKNTSLGVAVGYPDFISVGSTSINQTGQAFEIVFIWIATFLILNTASSLIVNGWNNRLMQKQGLTS